MTDRIINPERGSTVTAMRYPVLADLVAQAKPKKPVIFTCVYYPNAIIPIKKDGTESRRLYNPLNYAYFSSEAAARKAYDEALSELRIRIGQVRK